MTPENRHNPLIAGFWLSALIFALLVGTADAAPDAPQVAAEVPVGGSVASENACYVRLPDMPAARYGGFGAYNPSTGVLAYAGGAMKQADQTMTQHDMYAIRLDGSSEDWTTLPPAGRAGYTREFDRGCREMVSVAVSDDTALSVLGKDGCDNGSFSKKRKGGDIKALHIGDDADGTEVRWKPNSGAERLIGHLDEEDGRLVRHFATYDFSRERVIFGQGAFDRDFAKETMAEIYEAVAVGSKFRLRQLRPVAEGDGPGKRYGSCGAYIKDPEMGLDGVFLFGGKFVDEELSDAWWLDFKDHRDGRWNEVTSRIENMDEFGARYEGACAYDRESRKLYAWMGRADNDIADGAKRSGGVWRLDLGKASDAGASLRWERLAPDNFEPLVGRHMVPNVWDPINKRLFAIGGRNGDQTLSDVWAIYPDVRGAECAALDPYAPFRRSPSTSPPRVSPPPVPSDPSAPPVPGVCDSVRDVVPDPVIAAALANPTSVAGFGSLQFPGLPPGPQHAPALAHAAQSRSRLA